MNVQHLADGQVWPEFLTYVHEGDFHRRLVLYHRHMNTYERTQRTWCTLRRVRLIAISSALSCERCASALPPETGNNGMVMCHEEAS